MQWKTRRYTDHHIQNELLQILALCHLRKIAANIYDEAVCFTLECDYIGHRFQQQRPSVKAAPVKIRILYPLKITNS